MLTLLAGLTDEEIVHIVRSARASFVVYRHVGSDIVGWRKNSSEVQTDETIEIIEFADSVSEAVSLYNKHKI